MELEKIRKEIDVIDFQLLKLLNQRMRWGIITRKFKSNVEDKTREKDILKKIEQNSGTLIDADFCKDLFKDIITETKRLQEIGYRIIAFQGEHGAYSEVAAKIWDKEMVSVPCESFSGVFDGVNSGLYEFGIVPVENTLGGVVGQVNDLLMKTDLYVVGAVDLPISHCLLANPGTNHREIRKVYSHSQALAQCKHFLLRNNLEPIAYYDTAGAARMVTEKMLDNSAAIASKLSAELYNLEIIKEKIEDLDRNHTRFLIIAKNKNKKAGNKCSVLFSTTHKAGTLFSVLEIFAKAGINLTRIESMPNQPGNYAFFMDFIGSENDEKVKQVLEKMEKATTDFRFMGCYEEVIG